ENRKGAGPPPGHNERCPMNQFLFRRFLIPMFESGLKRRNTFRYWKELERTQWLSGAETADLQFAALRRLVAHALTHSPYYRDAWLRLGLSPEQLRSRDDFQRWPVIDRDV